jgi:CRISPR system Cascade subunit CasE
MYLARAFLNPASRAVRSDLADAVNLHRTVMRAFPDDAGPAARHAHRVLHRIDEDARRGGFTLLVQSATRPDFSRFLPGYFLEADDAFFDGENPAVREVEAERARIAAGARFAFRLRANTTKKVSKVDTATGTKTKNGMRVPVRGDEERLVWLSRHGAAGGFRVEEVRIAELRTRAHSGRTFGGALFEGRLVVTEPDTFRRALAEGIGPAKAFGFGLLSIQRPR